MNMWKMMMPRLFVVRSPLSHSSRRNIIVSKQRLFGSKPGPDSPPGVIRIEDDQTALVGIDLDRLRDTIGKIRQEIAYDSYDVNLILIGDADMKAVNFESTGVNAPTDILSFPFHEAVEPGVLEPPEFDVPDYYCLGDMLIDVPYVIRSCQDDQKVGDEDDSDYEVEDEDDREDRGVSLAMSKTFDPEQRLHQLLVHGMLHLVGFDHEQDDDYLAMVEREEHILKQLGL